MAEDWLCGSIKPYSDPFWTHALCYWLTWGTCQAACIEAVDRRLYTSPPTPAAPVVAGGGYSGAATDPAAVDDVIARTALQTQQQNDAFFRALGLRQQQKPADVPVITWLALGAGALAVVQIIRG